MDQFTDEFTDTVYQSEEFIDLDEPKINRRSAIVGDILDFILFGWIMTLIRLVLIKVFRIELDENRPLNWKNYLLIAVTVTTLIIPFIFFGLNVQTKGKVIDLNSYSYTVEYEMYGKTYEYETKLDSSKNIYYDKKINVYPVIGNPRMRYNYISVGSYIFTSLFLIIAIRFYVLSFNDKRRHDELLLELKAKKRLKYADDKDIEIHSRKTKDLKPEVETAYTKKVENNVKVAKGIDLRCPHCDTIISVKDHVCPYCKWRL